MSESETCLGLLTGAAEVQLRLPWLGDCPFIRSVDPLVAAPPRLARAIHFRALRSAAQLCRFDFCRRRDQARPLLSGREGSLLLVATF